MLLYSELTLCFTDLAEVESEELNLAAPATTSHGPVSSLRLLMIMGEIVFGVVVMKVSTKKVFLSSRCLGD
jgi:hypothetical protein